MLDTDKRLSNLEAGVVVADKKFDSIGDWNDLDTVLTNIRERIIDLKRRVSAANESLETSEQICLQVQAEQNRKV